MPATLLRLFRLPVRLLMLMTTGAMRGRLKDLDRELKIAARHTVGARRVRRAGLSAPLRIQLGCGPNPKPGWVNLDLLATADFQLDLRRPWPFEDGSAEMIYSEHFFEHLDYPGEVKHFLSEAKRVLAPGGVLSTGVPPTKGMLEAYVNGDDEFFRAVRERWHPDWCETPMDSINYHFRQDAEHKYAYDFETLSNALEKGGFVSIEQRSFDPDLDSELRRGSTMYVDACVPS